MACIDLFVSTYPWNQHWHLWKRNSTNYFYLFKFTQSCPSTKTIITKNTILKIIIIISRSISCVLLSQCKLPLAGPYYCVVQKCKLDLSEVQAVATSGPKINPATVMLQVHSIYWLWTTRYWQNDLFVWSLINKNFFIPSKNTFYSRKKSMTFLIGSYCTIILTSNIYHWPCDCTVFSGITIFLVDKIKY